MTISLPQTASTKGKFKTIDFNYFPLPLAIALMKTKENQIKANLYEPSFLLFFSMTPNPFQCHGESYNQIERYTLLRRVLKKEKEILEVVLNQR